MKTLLCGINAKYIHTNLAIRQIKGYVEKNSDLSVTIIEYTINNYTNEILEGIYNLKPDIIGFSCYIWNIEIVKKLTFLLKKVLPETIIVLGGPEVSYCPAEIMESCPCNYVISGEGEHTFCELIKALSNNQSPENIKGLSFKKNNNIVSNANGSALDMSDLPFPYENYKNIENRICYYEASRGCPFGCKYCLSSIEKVVRFAPIEKVKNELQIFIDNKVQQVKFVDRTFNCNKKFAMQIIEFLIENDNGITNFHFEVEASLLDKDIILLLSKARNKLFQLEIGVQTTNTNTLFAIDRKNNFEWITKCVKRLQKPENIHLHLDLIAGLPLEDYNSFADSFNAVHELLPHQLQLGFLKVLKGSAMEEMCEEYNIKHSPFPPYEVLSTNCLIYDEVLILKGIEELVEVYYNTNRFCNTVKYLRKCFNSYFELYFSLYNYKKEKGTGSLVHNKQFAYTFIYNFAKDNIANINIAEFASVLKLDYLLHEKPRSVPEWAGENLLSKNEIYGMIVHNNDIFNLLPEYFDCEIKQLVKLIHTEKFPINPYTLENKPVTLLFNYKNRDLWGNAKSIPIE